MRILVVGAGAVGGYFGARLLAAGRDVTFLVRPARAARLAAAGLLVRSRFGDLDLPAPPTVTADAIAAPFDLVLLSCKAYDLDGAIESFAPAVGPKTAILPLLNGMRHVDLLEARFGAAAVLGGLCFVSATLDAEGRILHLNELHELAFGERDGAQGGRIEAIAAALSDAGFNARRSDTILHDMWEKWMFIAASAGITCLMRAAVGDVVQAGGARHALALLDECGAIAAQYGFAPRGAFLQRSRAMLTAANSPIMASMARDIERGAPIEGEQIVGDFLRRAADPEAAPMLGIVQAHLCAYEVRRAREAAEGRQA